MGWLEARPLCKMAATSRRAPTCARYSRASLAEHMGVSQAALCSRPCFPIAEACHAAEGLIRA